MIIGIGNDIVSVNRIKKVIHKKYGSSFIKRVFTDHEIAYCAKKSNPYNSYSARWALKEAFYKALPQELQKLSSWKSIELINNNKKPSINICNEELQSIFKNNRYVVHHSISHEQEFATAFVVIEKM